MFKLPLAIVARLKYRGSLSYSIGLESPDKDVADGATRFLRATINREAQRAEEPGAKPASVDDKEPAAPGDQEREREALMRQATSADPAVAHEARVKLGWDTGRPPTRAERKRAATGD